MSPLKEIFTVRYTFLCFSEIVELTPCVAYETNIRTGKNVAQGLELFPG